MSNTQYFTVFGAAYVPEHHQGDGHTDVSRPISEPDPRAVASLVVFSALVTGMSVLAAEIFANGANRWLEATLMQ